MTGVMAPPHEAADGRNLRRLQSYERAVDALLDLIEEGCTAPTAQQIAARSGISVRTVFRLTEDMESLHAAAVQRQIERTAHLYVALPETGALDARIHALVKNRAEVFEAIAPVRRVGDRLAAGSDRIAAGLERHHRVLREQVARVFAPELARLRGARRPVALDAVDVAAGWETWDHLRRTRGLSAAAASRVVTLLVRGALESAAPS
jgi:AcrR family transcriptional regulator